VVVDAIDQVLDLAPRRILYGHHGAIEGQARIRRELERLKGAILYVHDRTVEAMNAGSDVWTAMREIRLPPELEVGEGYGQVSWDVRAIWESYLGWFHGRSTTELYATPASAVHADLVELAGGAGRVAERARQKLEAGHALEAIHLAEVALAAEPRHEGAVRVAIGAHERLAGETRNFWLGHWLVDQIRKLRERIG